MRKPEQKKASFSKEELERIGAAFTDFCQTIAALRDPESGCPWDLKQTHQSLTRFMLEEAYEAVEVMQEGSPEDLKDELGDVLLQVVLNAQVAKDDRHFEIRDVIHAIDEKMKRRHPHVFGDETFGSPEEHRARWDELKAQEKAKSSKGVFDNLPRHTCANHVAMEIGKRAKKIDFDWEDCRQVWEQLQSEVAELEGALKSSNFTADKSVNAELGDVYFTLGQLCRHLSADPEVIAVGGNRKFTDRFAVLEQLARDDGLNVNEVGSAKLEELWSRAKAKK